MALAITKEDKKLASKAKDLKIKYKMTLDDWNDMFNMQKGICELCKIAPASNVDYDKTNNKIRELVCKSCSLRLSKLAPIVILPQMKEYLSTH